MYIMCIILCLFNVLNRRVGALQISIIIIIIGIYHGHTATSTMVMPCDWLPKRVPLAGDTHQTDAERFDRPGASGGRTTGGFISLWLVIDVSDCFVTFPVLLSERFNFPSLVVGKVYTSADGWLALCCMCPTHHWLTGSVLHVSNTPLADWPCVACVQHTTGWLALCCMCPTHHWLTGPVLHVSNTPLADWPCVACVQHTTGWLALCCMCPTHHWLTGPVLHVSNTPLADWPCVARAALQHTTGPQRAHDYSGRGWLSW